jgi:uncharacterized OB-fold protein
VSHGEELTDPFWAAARDGVLVRPVCNACGANFFVPQLICPSCHSEAWSYQPSSGRGTIYSYTAVHRSPEPAFDAPYVLAIVDIQEGWSMLTRLLEPVPDGPLFGMIADVEFTADPVQPDRQLPTFRIREDQRCTSASQ